MKLFTRARLLVPAGMLAASVVSASAVHVSAQRPWHNTKATCEAEGYLWSDTKGCADEYCLDGLMGYGDPGETQVFQGHVYMCDGFTGQWTQVFLVHPTNGPFRGVAPPTATLDASGAQPGHGTLPTETAPTAPVGNSTFTTP